MIGDKTILAVIPARGGSKGLPGKNLMPLAGKPMIAWSVAAGMDSAYIDRLVFSTDDQAIADAAEAEGCEVPFLRPPELASDEARIEDAIFHLLDNLDEDFDWLVLLQPTSPLRTTDDIDACIEVCSNHDANSAVSVCETSKPPYWMYHIQPDGVLSPVIELPADGFRRQNLPPTYATNGAIYVVDIATLRREGKFVNADTVAYIMPPERSVDVDSKLDFLLVEALIDQGT